MKQLNLDDACRSKEAKLVLSVVRVLIHRKGIPPTQNEIIQELHILDDSRNWNYWHISRALKTLQAFGYITRKYHVWRSIQLVERISL